jgi:hypothetical protein
LSEMGQTKAKPAVKSSPGTGKVALASAK